ncbi:MAG: hypothetical protein KJ052_16540, partial [Candidatus Hydrogenedentes bacterium]|nr:hypothetical protein [Candidatus Hydrogenedentota bacterium]
MSQRHLIFPHIPKTAGTSVRRNLKEAFEQDMGESYCEIGVYNMAGDWVNPKAFGAHVLPRDWTFVYGHAT